MSHEKHVLVTGGGSGIGLAVARGFADKGYSVIIGGRDSQKLRSSGLRHIQINVTDEQSVMAAVDESGPIDILVANAGAAFTAPALRTPLNEWENMLAVNLTGVFLCARAFAPQMINKGWGRIITVASTASIRAYPYAAAYVAAKHGVLGLVKTLALEFAKTGVTVNAICPGFTDTPLFQSSVDNIVNKTGASREDAAMALLKGQPMGRLIQPEEVAHTALWLASEAAASVNGQSIVLDGGETIS